MIHLLYACKKNYSKTTGRAKITKKSGKKLGTGKLVSGKKVENQCFHQYLPPFDTARKITKESYWMSLVNITKLSNLPGINVDKFVKSIFLDLDELRSFLL